MRHRPIGIIYLYQTTRSTKIIMQTTYKLFFFLITVLMLHTSAAWATEVTNLTPKEVIEVVQTVDGLVVLDIRTPNEVQSGHLKDAKNIDFYGRDFKAKLDALNKETPYLIYCRTGRRSGVTIEYLQTAGFQQIYHLEKGINAWKAEGFPVMR